MRWKKKHYGINYTRMLHMILKLKIIGLPYIFLWQKVLLHEHITVHDYVRFLNHFFIWNLLYAGPFIYIYMSNACLLIEKKSKS